MAEKLRYAILNCRSIDMDNYMLTRNTDNAMEIEEDEPALWFARPAQSFSFALLPLFSGPVCSGATRFWIIFFPCFSSPKYQLWSVDNRSVVFFQFIHLYAALFLQCPMCSIFSCKLIIKWLEKKLCWFCFLSNHYTVSYARFHCLKKDFKIFDSNAKKFFCVKIQVATSSQYEYTCMLINHSGE